MVLQQFITQRSNSVVISTSLNNRFLLLSGAKAAYRIQADTDSNLERNSLNLTNYNKCTDCKSAPTGYSVIARNEAISNIVYKIASAFEISVRCFAMTTMLGHCKERSNLKHSIKDYLNLDSRIKKYFQNF